MVNDILIKHRPHLHLAPIKLINLIPDQMHSINLLIDLRLRLGHLILKPQKRLILKRPPRFRLVRSIVKDDYWLL